MGIKFSNNAATTLASGINNVVTTFTVAAGTGALFPTLDTAEDFFYCTLVEGLTREIVKVTSRSTDVFTVVRAQEGTSASAFTTAASVEHRLTAQSLYDLTERVSDYVNYLLYKQGVQ